MPDDNSCLKYLSELKWKNGHQCKRCGHVKYCSGLKEYDRQCTRCGYIESATAGTIFHKVKFSIRKAFWIVYFVSTNKKGISSTELSRKLQLRQKTCWLFKEKVMRAMASSVGHLLEGEVEIYDFVIGQQEEGVRGRKNKNKKLVILAVEKSGKGVNRIYAKSIEKLDKKTVKFFIKEHISQQAQIRTDAFST
ncbi:MAG: IS1595 family transposase [Bacteroidales bacterium]